MDLLERATIIHFHRHRIQAHGLGSVQALGWREAHSQRSRFEVIAAAADFANASVLDIGCGSGDLVDFLAERFGGFRYLGIEQVREGVGGGVPPPPPPPHAAWPHTDFVCADFTTALLPSADIVVACGAFGYRSADPHYVSDAIVRLYALAQRALIFNVLDAAVFPEHPLLVGRDVVALEAFCRTLCPAVELVRGYAEDDATVVMRRG
jgi:SAM-dependent methyltransferase